ncbi:DUF1353 domain-containing protein [Chelativorans alearense]|uniref:DUF1353 domain-containing protein n=1 Tax=Chelativorans alearense TaxID=2681495 RepID=UPI0013D27AF7|nr:DUF1353 domain-containing protein [Chelativorans alearense]
MSAYTEFTGTVRHVGGIRYTLTEPLIWHIGVEDGPAYTVPAGYIFDVSVPAFLRWLTDPHDKRYFKASALHDHMLEADWSRITAAAEFHNALMADDVPALRRLVMFLSVALWKYR